MKDQQTLDRIELLHPKLRKEARQIYDDICKALSGRAICRFSYTLRTFKEQDELYALGRTKPGKIVTKAPKGKSFHNYGMAIDIVLLWDKDGNGTYETAVWDVKTDYDNDKKSDWMEVVDIFRSYGWIWGGDWNNNLRSDDEKFLDYPHFQKTLGMSIHQCYNLYMSRVVDANGYLIF